VGNLDGFLRTTYIQEPGKVEIDRSSYQSLFRQVLATVEGFVDRHNADS
jgi:hypothetical protein